MELGDGVKLSPRQRQIIELVGGDGLSWKAVARRLGISQSTVRVHLFRLMVKLGSTHRPRHAIVTYYFRSGEWIKEREVCDDSFVSSPQNQLSRHR